MLKLYHDPISTTSRPVMLFLAEHELPVETIRVSLLDEAHKSDAFAAINPNCCVPALVDGDLAIGESSAILKYLADLAGSPAYPAELKARARINALMDWFNTGFTRDLLHGHVYPQIFPHCRLEHRAAQAEVLRRGLENGRRWLSILDRHVLAHGEPFLLGPAITLPDYLGAGFLSASEAVDFDLGPWPRIEAWMETMRRRPSWDEVFPAFYGMVSAIRDLRRAAG